MPPPTVRPPGDTPPTARPYAVDPSDPFGLPASAIARPASALPPAPDPAGRHSAAYRLARGRPPWGVADLALTVGGGLALAAALALLVFVQARLLGLEPSGSAWFGLLGTGAYAAFAVAAWSACLRRHGAPLAALGFRPARLRTLLLMPPAALGLLLANVLVVLPLTALLLGPDAAGEGEDPYADLALSGLDLLWIAVPLAVGAPLVEEVLFRGLLYGYLRGRWRRGVGLAAAVLLSAAIFAVLHIVVPPIFLMGVVLALLYERTASLWPGIVLHAVNNGLVVLSLALVALAT